MSILYVLAPPLKRVWILGSIFIIFFTPETKISLFHICPHFPLSFVHNLHCSVSRQSSICFRNTSPSFHNHHVYITPCLPLSPSLSHHLFLFFFSHSVHLNIFFHNVYVFKLLYCSNVKQITMYWRPKNNFSMKYRLSFLSVHLPLSFICTGWRELYMTFSSLVEKISNAGCSCCSVYIPSAMKTLIYKR